MASPSEIKQMILSEFASEEHGDEFWVLVPLEYDQKILIFVRIEKDYVQVSAPFALPSEINAEQAVAANFSFFGIGRDEEWWYVRHTVPISRIDRDQLQLIFNDASFLAFALASTLGQRENVTS